MACWNLGWNNPNQVGVFIAMWIPWLWALGAWVAVGLAGVVLLLWRLIRDRRFSGMGLVSVLLIAIGVILFATGFFSRIDPRFVSQDASAGNRLVLWKGGLQMIAASPWRGWGAGQSGSSFAHWFQPLNATEKYGGMLNSYLHVGVGYRLPMLVAVMTGAVGLWLVSWGGLGARRSEHGLPRDAAATLMMSSGSSWLVFMIANVFSSLWIFRNLWWLPAADGLVILASGWMMLGGQSFSRMARTKECQHFEIDTPLGIAAEIPIISSASPQVIVACGSRVPAGIVALLGFPEAHLILLHPLGTPVIPEGFKGKVTVILPMLDTKNSGRTWKSVCKRMGWNLLMSPGVGQDVRLVWPSALTHFAILY